MSVAIDYHFSCTSFTGFPEECGDVGVIVDSEQFCFLALVDALGHGPVAAAVAAQARIYLEGSCDKELGEIVQGLHEHLRSTRGAVAAVCRMNKVSGTLCYAAIGNITLIQSGRNWQKLTSQGGILGYMIPRPLVSRAQLQAGDLLIMHSDGIREHFNRDDFPGLLMGSAGDICTGMITQLGRKNDDVSCIVVRYDV